MGQQSQEIWQDVLASRFFFIIFISVGEQMVLNLIKSNILEK